MDKKVKDVFKSTELTNAKILNSKIGEIKFSKKLNSAIVSVESVENISLYDIEKFENEAREIYKLTSFKIDYKYVGNKIEIDERKVRDLEYV